MILFLICYFLIFKNFEPHRILYSSNLKKRFPDIKKKYVVNTLCRVFACALLYTVAVNGISLLAALSIVTESDIWIIVACLLVLVVLVVVMVFCIRKAKKSKYDLDEWVEKSYPMPLEIIRLKDLEFYDCKEEGQDELSLLADECCRKTIAAVVSFAQEVGAETLNHINIDNYVDYINKNNYCACDILAFAAVQGRGRLARIGTDKAKRMSNLFDKKMVYQVTKLLLMSEYQLRNFLQTREMNQNSPQQAIKNLRIFLDWDCTDINKRNAYGWEIPKWKERSPYYILEGHISKTLTSLQKHLENAFNDIFADLEAEKAAALLRASPQQVAPSCIDPNETEFCSLCGNVIPKGSTFCRHCGARLR